MCRVDRIESDNLRSDGQYLRKSCYLQSLNGTDKYRIAGQKNGRKIMPTLQNKLT